uniref:Uncharacterized protein n=1 Tax=Cacopsylla melanoneura TaxID=428564 RepID=A0A8D9EVI0_9HEMI
MQHLRGYYLSPSSSGAFCFVKKLSENPSFLHRMRRWSLFVVSTNKFWPTGDAKSRIGTEGGLCWWFQTSIMKGTLDKDRRIWRQTSIMNENCVVPVNENCVVPGSC